MDARSFNFDDDTYLYKLKYCELYVKSHTSEKTEWTKNRSEAQVFESRELAESLGCFAVATHSGLDG